MSFQRMLEMARRHGMPLVVTDPNGKEPMVVLPLELYEALVEGSAPAAAPVRKDSSSEPIMVPVREEAPAQNPPSSARMSGLSKPAPEPDLLAELSLEERFYIEPLEDAKNS